MYEEMKNLYENESCSLREIARRFGVSHHFVKRHLVELGVEVRPRKSGYKIGPFSEEHRKKLSESSKGKKSYWSGKNMPVETNFKNMYHHIQWDVNLDFLMKFDDIEKLKCLNRMLSRDRVSTHFDTEKYIKFVEKFYFDNGFNKQFEIFSRTKNKYDRPSLDHIIPLSRGGSWDLDNLRIVSWFENRAKNDMTLEEFHAMVKKYLI